MTNQKGIIMVKRSVALCEEKIIGIETIYTVIGGKQINIQNKVEELREKSKNKKLFCPCGCGANLVLVAGDKNLREQHFRIHPDSSNIKCDYVDESRTSVESKIVLKCWLDEKLQTDDLRMRVPIHDIDDTDRKYEFTFLSEKKKVAINYCHKRANLSDEKIKLLESNSKGINVIHIVDDKNDLVSYQYPEMMMKMQNAQGYCLLLKIVGKDYYKAELKAIYCIQTKAGLWTSIVIAEGLLASFSIMDGVLFFYQKSLLEIKDAAINKYYYDLEQKEKRLEEERREREEQERLYREKREQERIQEQKFWEDIRAKRQKELEEQRKREEEEAREREIIRKQRQEEEIKALTKQLDQQEKIVYDSRNRRLIKCEKCGKVGYDRDFVTYGGKGRLNLGICSQCMSSKKWG